MPTRKALAQLICILVFICWVRVGGGEKFSYKAGKEAGLLGRTEPDLACSKTRTTGPLGFKTLGKAKEPGSSLYCIAFTMTSQLRLFLMSSLFVFFNFLFIIYLLFLFLAVLGLRFCARAFSSCGKWGPLFIAARGPLTIAASLVAEQRLQTLRLSSCGSRAQFCSAACGIFPDQVSNPCPLHWQADSQPLRHQGSP